MGRTNNRGEFFSGNTPSNVHASDNGGLGKYGLACGGHTDAANFNNSMLKFSNNLTRTIKCRRDLILLDLTEYIHVDNAIKSH